MARSLKHLGFGRYAVLQDGVQIAGPLGKERAEEVARESPPKPPQNDREYWAKINADLARPINEELAEIKGILAKRRDEDEIRIILGQIEPILKAGKQARRRGRRLHVLPVAA